MPKFSDTQLIILATAGGRDDGSILPLPKKLKLDPDVVGRTFKDLLKKKLVAERPTVRPATVWREDNAGQPIALAITPAGLRAITAVVGERPMGDGAKTKRTGEPGTRKSSHSKAPRPPARRSQGREADKENAAASPLPRAGTKQAKLIELLQWPKGATIAEMVKATGWQAHSVRGVISGVLRKKLGVNITSAKEERGQVYRVAGSKK